MSDTQFSWMESYEAIADALLARKMRRDGIEALYEEITGTADRAMIDPLTFFTAFNRGMVDVDRRDMVRTVCSGLGVEAPLPTDFAGIPTANHELWQYFDNTPQAAEDCWGLFESALELADSGDSPSVDTALQFCEYFDKVHEQVNVTKARITRTLYWMRPKSFLPFGEKTREYVHSRYGLNTPLTLSGARYIRLLQEISAVSERPFYEITERAYRAADEDWWPPVSDYDPEMSVNFWMEILSDDRLTSTEVRNALNRMLAMGGSATTDELADDRGHDRDYYATLLRGYARDIAKHAGRHDYKGSWWPLLFVGQNADESRSGDYVWRLRNELSGALTELAAKE